MAFVAVVPAIGTGIAGLGGMAATGLGALGTAASSIPLIGGIAGPALSGLGGALGSIGGGLGGGLIQLGGGAGLGSALGTAGQGLLGAGHSILGSAGAGGAMGSGLAGMGTGLGGLFMGSQMAGGGAPVVAGVAPVAGGKHPGWGAPGGNGFGPWGGMAGAPSPQRVAGWENGWGTPPLVAGIGGGVGSGRGVRDYLQIGADLAGDIGGLGSAIESTQRAPSTPEAQHHTINIDAARRNMQPMPMPQRQTGIYDAVSRDGRTWQ